MHIGGGAQFAAIGIHVQDDGVGLGVLGFLEAAPEEEELGFVDFALDGNDDNLPGMNR